MKENLLTGGLRIAAVVVAKLVIFVSGSTAKLTPLTERRGL